MTDGGGAISTVARAWIEEEIGARIENDTVLEGSTSATLFSLRLVSARGEREAVLRLFTNVGWLTEEPDLAKHEAAILRWLAGSGLPVPELIAVDEEGRRCGFPAVLMSRVPGAVDLHPDDLDGWLERQADALAAIHALPHQGFGWRYRSWNTFNKPKVPTWTRHPVRWRRAIDLWRAGPPDEPDRLLHRDYHPLNTLWQGGQLSGVVDWVNACVGPASADLSHCRGNLVQTHGPDAADRFLARYRERVPEHVYHPYWDVDALVSWLPSPGIYPPWATFGLELTMELVQERIEQFMERVAMDL